MKQNGISSESPPTKSVMALTWSIICVSEKPVQKYRFISSDAHASKEQEYSCNPVSLPPLHHQITELPSSEEMFSEIRHQWILCKIFREEGVRCITHSSGWPSRKTMEFTVLWGTSAVSSVCGFSSPILQKLFPVAVKERAEQRGSWQIDRLTKRKLCEAKPTQCCANARVHKVLQTEQPALIRLLSSLLRYRAS